MVIRKIPFVQGEYYHIYNRGVDKRVVFSDGYDFKRFKECLVEFNTASCVGSLEERRKEKNRHPMPVFGEEKKLVDIIAYCLNSNHFHLILTPLVDNGISKFMHKLGMGYTNFFNIKNSRSGSLFQGKFKAIHIDSDEYLTLVGAYVNLNNKVHKNRHRMPKKFSFRSSWDEYLKAKIIKNKKGDNQIQNSPDDICCKKILLARFNSIEDYKKFSISSLEGILKRSNVDVNNAYKDETDEIISFK
ncbi:MAG: transposase [Patescibacteria group bacterium]|nr:transposase [Patescibacteria group bacterium]